MTGRKRHPAARDVWNVEPMFNQRERRRDRTLGQKLRTKYNMSPNDYLWSPRNDVLFVEDQERREEELKAETKAARIIQFAEECRDQYKRRKRYERPPLSERLLEELRKYFKSLHSGRKLLGRPSVSAARGNHDEYCESELYAASAVASENQQRPPSPPEIESAAPGNHDEHSKGELGAASEVPLENQHRRPLRSPEIKSAAPGNHDEHCKGELGSASEVPSENQHRRPPSPPEIKSAPPGNHDDNYKGELSAASEVASEKPHLRLFWHNMSRFGSCANKKPTDQPTNQHRRPPSPQEIQHHPQSTSVTKDPPPANISVIMYSAPSSSAEDTRECPDLRSAMICDYVLEVIECYQMRRGQYALDLLFIHLGRYCTKMTKVQNDFLDNALGIHDRFTDFELRQCELDITTAAQSALTRMGKVQQQWQECNEMFALLDKIAMKMAVGCFDRGTLRLAKKVANKMIAVLKLLDNSLISCFDPVAEMYDILSNIQEYLKFRPVDKS